MTLVNNSKKPSSPTGGEPDAETTKEAAAHQVKMGQWRKDLALWEKETQALQAMQLETAHPLLMVTSDRPVYSPGEMIRGRFLLLTNEGWNTFVSFNRSGSVPKDHHGFELNPNTAASVTLLLRNSRGNTVWKFTPSTFPNGPLLHFDVPIPVDNSDFPGGDYTLKAQLQLCPAGTVSSPLLALEIRAHKLPTFHIEATPTISPVKDGSGDATARHPSVELRVKVTRTATGKPAVGATVIIDPVLYGRRQPRQTQSVPSSVEGIVFQLKPTMQETPSDEDVVQITVKESSTTETTLVPLPTTAEVKIHDDASEPAEAKHRAKRAELKFEFYATQDHYAVAQVHNTITGGGAVQPSALGLQASKKSNGVPVQVSGSVYCHHPQIVTQHMSARVGHFTTGHEGRGVVLFNESLIEQMPGIHHARGREAKTSCILIRQGADTSATLARTDIDKLVEGNEAYHVTASGHFVSTDGNTGQGNYQRILPFDPFIVLDSPLPGRLPTLLIRALKTEVKEKPPLTLFVCLHSATGRVLASSRTQRFTTPTHASAHASHFVPLSSLLPIGGRNSKGTLGDGVYFIALQDSSGEVMQVVPVFLHFTALEQQLNVRVTMSGQGASPLPIGSAVQAAVTVTDKVTGTPVKDALVLASAIESAALHSSTQQRRLRPRLCAKLRLEPALPLDDLLLDARSYWTGCEDATLSSEAKKQRQDRIRLLLVASRVAISAMDSGLVLKSSLWQTGSSCPLADRNGRPQEPTTPSPVSYHLHRRRAKLMHQEVDWAMKMDEMEGAEPVKAAMHHHHRKYSRSVQKTKPQPVPRVRRYFHPTVGWPDSFLRTNGDGVATFDIKLADSVTLYDVVADVVGPSGQIAEAPVQTLQTIAPLVVSTRLPFEVTTGDTMTVPVQITVSHPQLLGAGDRSKLWEINLDVAPTDAVIASSVGLRVVQQQGASSCQLQFLPNPDGGGRASTTAVCTVDVDIAVRQALDPSRLNVPTNVTLRFAAMTRGEVDGDFLADTIELSMRVVPVQLGAQFTSFASTGGVVDLSSENRKEMERNGTLIHLDLDPSGSVESFTIDFTSPLSTITNAIEGLLREPCGCFEQTASTAYPNALALQYIQRLLEKLRKRRAETPSPPPVSTPSSTSTPNDSNLISWLEKLRERSLQLLKTGYKKLKSYETREKGFEWFGGVPAHEGLTAYGTMLFADMKRATEKLLASMGGEFGRESIVEPPLNDRTHDWIRSRRDGTGGFKRSTGQAWDDFGKASPQVTDAYILWASSQSGTPLGGEEVKKLNTLASERLQDRNESRVSNYVAALVANALQTTTNNDKLSDQLLDDLKKSLISTPAGSSLPSTGESITSSRGRTLAIETTSLFAIAMAKHTASPTNARTDLMDPIFDLSIERWLYSTIEGGRFGSTQSTIMVLKALLALDELRTGDESTAPSDTIFEVTIGGRVMPTLVELPPQLLEGKRVVIKGRDFQAAAEESLRKCTSGDERVTKCTAEISLRQISGGNASGGLQPFSAQIEQRVPHPASSPASKVALLLSGPMFNSRGAVVKVGHFVPLNVQVRATKVPKPVGMITAIVGVPGGFEIQTEALRQEVAGGRLAFFELRGMGRECVLYWRGISSEAKHQTTILLKAIVAGTFSAPLSQVYEYYNDDHRSWLPASNCTIAPP